MFHVLVSDKMSNEGLQPLLESDLISVVQKNINEVSDLELYDGLMVRSATKVTADVIEKMPNLKIIARAGVGVDNIDLDAATKRGIIVVNAPSGNTISTAEHTFALMMALARDLGRAFSTMKKGEWNRSSFQGVELNGKTLGIVGFGRIGAEIAKRAKAFQMTVLTYDPFLTQSRAEKLRVKPVSFDELLTTSDFITVHTPLTKETKGLFNKDNIGRTKPGVFFINCARGGIIDENALIHYINSGHVRGAALDVFVDEPTKNQELVDLENVLTTPHIAATTAEAQLNVAVIVSEEILKFAKNEPVHNGINSPAVSGSDLEKIHPYYELCKTMGTIVSKLAQGRVKHIDVCYSGEITALQTNLTTRSLLAGFLQPKVDWIVNDVNAPVLAKEYGISFGEKYADNGSAYTNLIKVIVETDQTTFTIAGTYIKDYGPRLVQIDGFGIDFSPIDNVLVVEHIDKAGVIGRIGQSLGAADINIAAMQVGRKEQGGAAIMVINVDKTLTDETVKGLTAIPEVTRVNHIEL